MAGILVTVILKNKEEQFEIKNFPSELFALCHCDAIITFDGRRFQTGHTSGCISINVENPKKPIVTITGKFLE